MEASEIRKQRDDCRFEWETIMFLEGVLEAIALTDHIERPSGQNAYELAAAALGRG